METFHSTLNFAEPYHWPCLLYTSLAIWGGCLKVFTENPLFGVGAGTENVTNLLQNRFGINQPHAHSLYFELLVEGGLISILFFVAVLSRLVYDLFYLLRSGRKWRRMGDVYKRQVFSLETLT